MMCICMLSYGSAAPKYTNAIVAQCFANPTTELAHLCSVCHTLVIAQKSLQASGKHTVMSATITTTRTCLTALVCMLQTSCHVALLIYPFIHSSEVENDQEPVKCSSVHSLKVSSLLAPAHTTRHRILNTVLFATGHLVDQKLPPINHHPFLCLCTSSQLCTAHR